MLKLIETFEDIFKSNLSDEQEEHKEYLKNIIKECTQNLKES